MKKLRIHLDFETRSIFDLRSFGADMYAQHFSTSPIMLSIVAPELGVAYVEDFLLGNPAYHSCIYPFAKPGDLNYRMIKPPCPPAILRAIELGFTFVAHNARFEQAIYYHICHLIWGWPWPAKWSCTAARSRYWGIRASLEGAASDLEVIHQKNEAGKDFIKNYCCPRKYKGAKKNGIITELWYEPQQAPEGWQIGLQYCLEDSYAEKDIDDVLPDLPPFEQAIWDLDFKLNTRGLPIDIPSVRNAIKFSEYFTEAAFKRFDEITSLRPTQRDKVLEYINQREEIDALGDLRSKTLKRIVLDDLPADLREVIAIRLNTSRASNKKLFKMLNCAAPDHFIRGGHLYGGAHTMRWSHKLVQTGNMIRPDPDAPQDYMFDFLTDPVWREQVGHNGGPPIDELPQQAPWVAEAGLRFMNPLTYLATSMRGFIRAPDGKKLVAGDYAQIEARVLAWLARCHWLLDAFRSKDDVYCRFAGTHMYARDYASYFEYRDGIRYVRKIYKRERQVAKSAVLGCGYGLGSRKFVEYCDNSDLIITQEESDSTIRAYREAHPEIADRDFGLWSRVEKCCILAVANEGGVVELANTGVTFHVHRLDTERYWLVCTLPSGRHVAYYRPKVRLGTKWGRTVEILSFRTEWNSKSYREDTYGGKLVENLVQAIARDVCAVGALNVEAAGYPVIGLVHDEVISLPDIDFGSHQHLCEQMVALPAWITDLPVEAEGATMIRYGK